MGKFCSECGRPNARSGCRMCSDCEVAAGWPKRVKPRKILEAITRILYRENPALVDWGELPDKVAMAAADAGKWHNRPKFSGGFEEGDFHGKYGMFGAFVTQDWEMSFMRRSWIGKFGCCGDIQVGTRARLHLVGESGKCWDGEAVIEENNFRCYSFKGCGAPLIDGKELA